MPLFMFTLIELVFSYPVTYRLLSSSVTSPGALSSKPGDVTTSLFKESKPPLSGTICSEGLEGKAGLLVAALAEGGASSSFYFSDILKFKFVLTIII